MNQRRTGWPEHLILVAQCFSILTGHYKLFGLDFSGAPIYWELVQNTHLHSATGLLGPVEPESAWFKLVDDHYHIA